MRNIFIYTAIAFLSAATGCAQVQTTKGKTEPPKNTPEISLENNSKVENKQLKLETEFKNSARGLIVAYKIINNSDKNVFLINKIPVSGNGGFNYRPENYYLLPVESDLIQISKQAFFIDEKSTATSAVSYLPAAIRLNAGQTFQESFEVGKPFEIIHPYKDVTKLQLLPKSPKGVRFCVAIVEDDGQKVREEQIENEKVILLNAASLQKQQLICGDVDSAVLQ